MAGLRPEALATLARWQETLVAAAVVLAGLWIAGWGGWFFAGLGLLVGAVGLALGVIALRRLRFVQGGAAPGVVEVDEGQVRYLGPAIGGAVALPDLAELRLIRLQGRPVWRLKQADGQALLIPAEATGAERLYDAFASLPGIDLAALAAALEPGADPAGDGRALALPEPAPGRLIWQRPGLRLAGGI